MPRGGIHKGTLKSSWESGKTCAIRVPLAKKEQFLRIARALDKIGGEFCLVDAEKYRQAIDLLIAELDYPINNGSKYRNQTIEALELLGEDMTDKKHNRRRSTTKKTPIGKDTDSLPLTKKI